MTLIELEAYAGLHMQSIDVSLHQHIREFVSFVTSEDERVREAIAHLEALGYSVVKGTPAA